MYRTIILLVAVSIITMAVGCSNNIRATGENTYKSNYLSYRNEDDARKQAIFEATMECTGLGKKMSILSEEKWTKRGFVHVLEFECVD
jgi:hypothetical protein